MKIAIPTDDNKHVSDAFGHAHYFFVIDEETQESELRHNPEAHGEHRHMRRHNSASHRKVETIAELLKDVDIIITSHIGKPMIDRMSSEGKVIYISPKSLEISEALDLYFKGNLKTLNLKTKI